MKQTVGIVIATFGDEEYWGKLADRAIASVEAQTLKPDKIVRIHGKTLHESRNDGVRQADCDLIVVCDADDEIHEEYIAYMVQGDGDVRIPSVQLYYDMPPKSRVLPPFVIRPGVSLQNRNHVPIGAMFRRDAFDKVGGFKDWPIFEDWWLWCEMWLAGYQNFQTIPEAIYKVHSRLGSRNSQVQYAAQMVREVRALFERAEGKCATSA